MANKSNIGISRARAHRPPEGVSFYKVMPTYSNPQGKNAYIMNMYTRPAYRRKGIASKLLDLLIREAINRGIKKISLEATEMGKLVYRRYGFVPMENEMEYQKH